MNGWEVVLGGLSLLMMLAVLIGVRLDQEARNSAWARIATARRINAETRDELEQHELLLDLREQELEVQERRLDLRETRFLEREEMLAEHERQMQRGLTHPQWTDRSTTLGA